MSSSISSLDYMPATNKESVPAALNALIYTSAFTIRDLHIFLMDERSTNKYVCKDSNINFRQLGDWNDGIEYTDTTTKNKDGSFVVTKINESNTITKQIFHLPPVQALHVPEHRISKIITTVKDPDGCYVVIEITHIKNFIIKEKYYSKDNKIIKMITSDGITNRIITNVIDEKTNNTTIKSDEIYKDGKKHGFCTYYHNNGNVLSEYNYSKDKKSGKYNTYYLNGSLESTGKYLNDKKTDISDYYDKNGVKTSINHSTGEILYTVEDDKNKNNTEKSETNKTKEFNFDISWGGQVTTLKIKKVDETPSYLN
jgi:antitoxin component YwqK of YwqJK toxin-antitoxin module